MEDNIGMDFREKVLGRCGLVASRPGYGPVAGCCEHGNEPSGSIKARNFFNTWVTVSLLKSFLLHGVT